MTSGIMSCEIKQQTVLKKKKIFLIKNVCMAIQQHSVIFQKPLQTKINLVYFLQGSSSQGGGYSSGQDSSSSGSSQYGGQGSNSSGGSQSGGQGGCDCSGGSSGGSPTLVRSDSSSNVRNVHQLLSVPCVCFVNKMAREVKKSQYLIEVIHL
ncbi:uncharacterized protein ACIBXB_019821 isoform 1-T1 [Morphnus guianensis]